MRKGAVTLFMNASDQYIMAFQGADMIYVLQDQNSQRFKTSLEKEQGGKQAVKILGWLAAGHGQHGLGTFQRNDSGLRAAVYRRPDLDSAACLSTYSERANNVRHESLRAALSLLVCMISESARHPMLQNDFTSMYFDMAVVADEAIRSYDDAKYLLRLAHSIFPQYPRRLAVEKLQKRASELNDLLAALQGGVSHPDPKRLLVEIAEGRMKSANPSSSDHAKRLRHIAQELSFFDPTRPDRFDPNQITQLISTCKSESAIRAAKQGVAVPPLPPASR
jgi:hypothetical protein